MGKFVILRNRVEPRCGVRGTQTGQGRRSTRLCLDLVPFDLSLRACAVRGLSEIETTFRRAALIRLLVEQDNRARFRRTTLGSFWSLIQIAAWIAGIGLVYGVIFNQPMVSYLPLVALGSWQWALIAGVLAESPAFILGSANILRSVPIPIPVATFRGLIRIWRTAMLAAVIPAMTLLWFRVPLHADLLITIPAGVFLTLALTLGIALILAPLGTRYRDVQVLAQMLATFLWLVSPVFWSPSQVTSQAWIVDFNPFGWFIQILRGPILGESVPAWYWLAASGTATLVLLASVWVTGRAGRRILVWL